MTSHRSPALAHSRHFARRILLVPAVVVCLMAAAAPAVALCVAGHGAKPARTAAIAKGHAHARSHTPPRWMEFGRKVG